MIRWKHLHSVFRVSFEFRVYGKPAIKSWFNLGTVWKLLVCFECDRLCQCSLRDVDTAIQHWQSQWHTERDGHLLSVQVLCLVGLYDFECHCNAVLYRMLDSLASMSQRKEVLMRIISQ